MAQGIQSKRITVDGVGVHCFHAGRGKETIILLHGAGVDSARLSWAEVLPLLAERYHVIAPDLPGYGASQRISGEYSLPFYTNIAKGVIEAFGGGPVILCGLSLGGGIALNTALTYPELVKVLIPVDAWGLSNKLPWHRLTYWYTRSKLNQNIYKWTATPWMVRWSLEYNLISDKSKVTDEMVNEIVELMKAPDAGKAFMSFQKAEITPTGLTRDLSARFAEIRQPTLLIHGSHDAAVPLKDAIAASRQIADCELYVMEGGKHWPQKERPEEFANAVLSYLDRRLS
ncbi:MAG: alpha/beta hydrolase [Anaerolineales bacterium]|nr:alpha/beta hydrolase [Anaerolineales bacterium]